MKASSSDRFNLFQGQDTGVFIVSEEGWTPQKLPRRSGKISALAGSSDRSEFEMTPS